LVHLSSLTPEQGARTIVYLASSLDVEGVTGKYFVREREVASDPVSYDEAAARMLWEVSEKMTLVPERSDPTGERSRRAA
ncbi:MAG TPA: hypothetical protein VF982_10635, partial [Anaerolineales bacterium]